MGSRGRSIRLRIYFLVAIPLITMLGLFAYVAYTSINYWLTLDKAPSLIKATDVPMTRTSSACCRTSGGPRSSTCRTRTPPA